MPGTVKLSNTLACEVIDARGNGQELNRLVQLSTLISEVFCKGCWSIRRLMISQNGENT